MGAYEKLIPVSSSVTSGQTPIANGQGGYTWGTPDTEIYKTATVVIAASDWNNGNAIVEVANVSANKVVVCSPIPESSDTVAECGIYMTSQGNGTLTFTALESPDKSVSFNAVIMQRV